MEQTTIIKDFSQVSNRVNSPSEVSFEPPLTLNKPFSKFSLSIKIMGIIMMLLMLVLFLWPIFLEQPQLPYHFFASLKSVDPFEYRVHCPINYFPIERKTSSWFWGDYSKQKRKNFGPYEFTQETVEHPEFNALKVFVIQLSSKKLEDGTQQLVYCGLAREFEGDCESSSYVCQSPGAMFEFNIGDSADVVWINSMNASIYPQADSCLTNRSASQCIIKYKTDLKSTYYLPTNLSLQDNIQQVQIEPHQWPVSTHVHGLEVRPTFDGNPSSWTSNAGKYGPGALSLDDDCYYKNFDQSQTNSFVPLSYKFSSEHFNQRSKTNRYPNIQNPGNLWYHDHAMHLTLYNAAGGLSGIYILRDPKLYGQLPHCDFERFIMKTVSGWEDTNLPHLKNYYYRYRILNNDPSTTITIYFTHDAACMPNNTIILFDVIGADTSLFNKPLFDEKTIELASAERIQILIKFNGDFRICTGKVETDTIGINFQPQETTTVGSYVVMNATDEVNEKVTKSLCYPKDFDPKKLSLDVNYEDLSKIPQSEIAKTRMRPIMKDGVGYKVNGHYSFHRGSTQNPEIGTIQDWWMINVALKKHPMHFHLVNFQVIQSVTLRYFTITKKSTTQICPFYLAEFYLRNILVAIQHKTKGYEQLKDLHNLLFWNDFVDYHKLCTLITLGTIQEGGVTYRWDDYLLGPLEEASYLVNIEDVFDENNVSGINLLEKIQPSNATFAQAILMQTNCPKNTQNKFICSFDKIKKSWYRQWKDTALVKAGTALLYRIRWASNTYKGGKQYFHVPVDQLREFPGYVYHCHVLSHEDKQMMRPYMLQPPSDYISTNPNSKCRQKMWYDKFKCLNEQCRNSAKHEKYLTR